MMIDQKRTVSSADFGLRRGLAARCPGAPAFRAVHCGAGVPPAGCCWGCPCRCRCRCRCRGRCTCPLPLPRPLRPGAPAFRAACCGAGVPPAGGIHVWHHRGLAPPRKTLPGAPAFRAASGDHAARALGWSDVGWAWAHLQRHRCSLSVARESTGGVVVDLTAAPALCPCPGRCVPELRPSGPPPATQRRAISVVGEQNGEDDDHADHAPAACFVA